MFFKKLGQETCSQYLTQQQCAISDIVKFSSELTSSAKTVAFVEITRQTFCSYAVAFLFSKAKKFDFLL